MPNIAQTDAFLLYAEGLMKLSLAECGLQSIRDLFHFKLSRSRCHSTVERRLCANAQLTFAPHSSLRYFSSMKLDHFIFNLLQLFQSKAFVAKIVTLRTNSYQVSFQGYCKTYKQKVNLRVIRVHPIILSHNFEFLYLLIALVSILACVIFSYNS